jgi:AraC-like DNA-binding protein
MPPVVRVDLFGHPMRPRPRAPSESRPDIRDASQLCPARPNVILLGRLGDQRMATTLMPRDVQQALALLKANSARGHTIKELAVACRVAPRTLQKHFHQFLGRSPTEVLRDLRLDLVRRESLWAGTIARSPTWRRATASATSGGSPAGIAIATAKARRRQGAASSTRSGVPARRQWRCCPRSIGPSSRCCRFDPRDALPTDRRSGRRDRAGVIAAALCDRRGHRITRAIT